MTPFAQRCGLHDAARAAAVQAVLRRVEAEGLQRVRVAWADLHGVLRAKTLLPSALPSAFDEGVGFVSTLALKDLADRTALPVFDPAAMAALAQAHALDGFGRANNLVLVPDPASLQRLPWAEHTGWLRAEPFFGDGQPLALDPRRALQRALATLAEAGWTVQCGLELEFHVYRLDDPRLPLQPAAGNAADPAAVPGIAAPAVSGTHPGWQLLSEAHADRAEAVLALVQHTAEGLGLPLRSLEIEIGPSQFEAVFAPTEALQAADQLVLFRNGVRQALARAGFHASFVCRPPFAGAVASGWHLHHSLLDAEGRNAFMPRASATGEAGSVPASGLSPLGAHWLAGLLAHGRAMAALATPTLNGWGRFQPGAMAPMALRWGRDNRGAMLRVLGGPGDPATRIENRLGEPMANPYLFIAAQVWAGLDGVRRKLLPPPPSDAPYAPAVAPLASQDAGDARLPAGLAEALDALHADAVFATGMGPALHHVYDAVRRQEIGRHAETTDPQAWAIAEYFARH
jgi:glutamine synthetase